MEIEFLKLFRHQEGNHEGVIHTQQSLSNSKRTVVRRHFILGGEGLNDECMHKYTEAREAWGRKSFLSRCSEIAFETTCCIL